MNNKIFKRIHSESKVQWLRMGFIWGFILAFSIINIGCNKKDADIKVPDEYYIKYEVSSNTIYYGGKLDVTINSETNKPVTITINQRTLWETLIGPVQKGFNATLNVTAIGQTHDKLKLYTNIYVSKNGSPFALKKIDGSDTPRDNVSVNYTIDY